MGKEFRNNTNFNRAIHDKNNPYLMVSSKTINDSRLTDAQLGLLIRMLNNSDDYVLNITYFGQHKSSLGQTAFGKAKKVLQELGYLEKKRKQGGCDWIINELASKDIEVNNSDIETVDSAIPETTNNESTTVEINSNESNNIESSTLTNTNESINNEINNKKTIKKESNNKEININDKLEVIDSSHSNFDSISNSLSNDVKRNELQIKFINIFNLDDLLLTQLNMDKGTDVVDFKVIEDFITKINQIWNNPTLDKFDEFTEVYQELLLPIFENFPEINFEDLCNRKFEELPQSFITKNNVILSQLFLNLFDFVDENEVELKRLDKTPIGERNNIDGVPKHKKKEYTKTTRMLDFKTKKEIVHYPTTATVSKEDFDKYNQLLIANRTLEKDKRIEDMIKIKNLFQEYFNKKFDGKICNLIEERKAHQIKFNNDSKYNFGFIHLYYNNVLHFLNNNIDVLAV